MGLPSLPCLHSSCPAALGFAKRCWHGNFILPSTYLSPLSMPRLPKPFFQLGEAKESASAAKGDLLCTCRVFGMPLWLKFGQKAIVLQMVRDGSGTGRWLPKASSIDYSAKASLLIVLRGRNSASRCSKGLAWKGVVVL